MTSPSLPSFPSSLLTPLSLTHPLAPAHTERAKEARRNCHFGKGEENQIGQMAAGDVASLGTRLAVSFPAASTTVADLKRRVSHEHAACFPNFGQIAVQSVKVDQGGAWFHLADSMAVRDAFQFHGANETWHLQVDALPHPQHLDQGMATEGHSKDSSATHSEPSCEMLGDQVKVEVGADSEPSCEMLPDQVKVEVRAEETLAAKGKRSSNGADPKGSKEAEATSTEQRACDRRLRPRTRVGKTPITKAVNSSGSSESEGMDINTVGVDAPPSQFVVMLKECHFVTKNGQYLNVPRGFSVAHRYAERKKVLLRMGGESWMVNLKHVHIVRGKTRTSFRYGWHQFCVDNHLRVGETCFFRALGQGGGGDRHVLKVEVRRLDGSYAS
ncbi:hypothetical protein CFC21_025476 [Triticum aestivum]|uniref:TF-B3 domain-containing protein n=2 Tax=Triticum aestivum TaxID=4565 RepID=A0A3B6CFG9_WHEAT|nr:uncharacterized protein LOC123042111 [Triticum aestivum]KAF7011138.1 hypothetical protein CFC21_025476 [Triticum aestivum]